MGSHITYVIVQIIKTIGRAYCDHDLIRLQKNIHFTSFNLWISTPILTNLGDLQSLTGWGNIGSDPTTTNNRGVGDASSRVHVAFYKQKNASKPNTVAEYKKQTLTHTTAVFECSKRLLKERKGAYKLTPHGAYHKEDESSESTNVLGYGSWAHKSISRWNMV